MDLAKTIVWRHIDDGAIQSWNYADGPPPPVRPTRRWRGLLRRKCKALLDPELELQYDERDHHWTDHACTRRVPHRKHVCKCGTSWREEDELHTSIRWGGN